MRLKQDNTKNMPVNIKKKRSKIRTLIAFIFALNVIILLLLSNNKVVNSSPSSKLLLSGVGSVEYFCQGMKIRISQEGPSQTRLRVDIQRNTANGFLNLFDVTVNGSGSIVRARNTNLLSSENPTQVEIIKIFKRYRSIYEDNQCLS